MLDEIVIKQRQLLPDVKKAVPLASFENKIIKKDFALSKRVMASDWSLIAECKLSSPVKGRLCLGKSVTELAVIYQDNGAGALSVHTNEYFTGKLADLQAVKSVTSLPVMRKEFIIDPYQVYETAYAGVEALLLIARIVSARELKQLYREATALGLDCLVEVHDEGDIDKTLSAGCQLLGVNNRDLQTFVTDTSNTLKLLQLCQGKPVISESGFKNQKDALTVKQAGVKGILVGEGLVKAEDIGKKTRQMALVEDE